MRFTKEQYESAIQSLRDGMEQLEPDGRMCTVCGDGGHQAFECGHNPLLAMEMCYVISKISHDFHETLHWFAGHDFRMGVQHGPAAVIPPSRATGDNK